WPGRCTPPRCRSAAGTLQGFSVAAPAWVGPARRAVLPAGRRRPGRSTAAPSQCRPRWLASLRPRKAPARPAARRPRTPRARRPGPARRSHEQATAEPCCRLRVSVRADDLLQLWQQARRRDHDELPVLTVEVVDGGVRDAGSEPARVARFVEVVPN